MKSYHIIKPEVVKNRKIITIGIIALLVVDIFQLIVPRIVKHAVDSLTSLDADTSTLIFYSMLILGSSCMIALARYFWRRCLNGFARKIERNLRDRLFVHLQTLSATYFNKKKTGDLMAHGTNDIKNIRMAAGMGMVALTDAIFLGSAAIGFMVYIEPKLTLMSVLPMPLIVLASKFFSKRMHQQYQKVQATFADMTEVVRERFAGIRVIKAYNMERSETESLRSVSRLYVKSNIDLTKITGSLFPMMIVITNISLAIVLYFGGYLTILNEITTGDFVAFISYLNLLTWPMMAMGWVINLIQRGRASLDRIGEILDAKSEIVEAVDIKKSSEFKGEIIFKNVFFRYEPALPEVLKNINFTIGSGKTLGIVGPPGSGKTSLVNLVPRIYDAGQGKVLIDGIGVKEMSRFDLRSGISFMPQEPFLFAGTIRENITFNSPEISEEKLIKAAQEASFYDTVCSFPKGFETVIGEKGIILWGQKQRIALTRALLRDAPILIVDDPISQVDTATGAVIIETLSRLAGKKTLIIVSHRYSAVRDADLIIVMSEGEITGIGPHEELLEKNDYYARTYKMQVVEEGMNEK